MRIIVFGACGRMGQQVIRLAEEGFRGASLHAGVDLGGNQSGFPCYQSPADVPEGADCIIDFSHHAATKSLLDYAIKAHLPVVLSTTGHTDSEKKLITEAAKEIPVFFSANMSMGVALLAELAKKTAALYPHANIEIVETHHNRKLDAPSGTALMIAEGIREILKKATFLCGRGGHGKRADEEIGIHAIRMGNIVGTHEVLVGTDAETITLKHEAHDRALFAEGAIAAAEFLCKQPAGLYKMQDMIKF
ncbi:MAG: 4-hydroxy-tetrahydrodipicolinate reductase [Clostridia bacterium]|nr:4-hydroxy-tetrahydrodipicolinate reductase [Clostridia bacterium]